MRISLLNTLQLFPTCQLCHRLELGQMIKSGQLFNLLSRLSPLHQAFNSLHLWSEPFSRRGSDMYLTYTVTHWIPSTRESNGVSGWQLALHSACIKDWYCLSSENRRLASTALVNVIILGLHPSNLRKNNSSWISSLLSSRGSCAASKTGVVADSGHV